MTAASRLPASLAVVSPLRLDLGPDQLAFHARIAEIADDPIVRARHLALGTDAPDADVARVLDEAAGFADERGGAVRAELAEQALRLTPPMRRDERTRGRWRPRAHTRHRRVDAREVDRRDLLAEVDEGALRAETLLLLADFERDDLAVPVLEEALRPRRLGSTARGPG